MSPDALYDKGFFFNRNHASNLRLPESKNVLLEHRHPWPIYDSPACKTMDSFLRIISEEGLADELKPLRERRGRGLRALDVAGQGSWLLDYTKNGIGEVVAVTLRDFRDPEKQKEDRSHHLEVVEGDIFRGKTWLEISKRSSKFDLVVCRPEGPMHDLSSKSTALALLDKMYQMLDVGGILLTQIPFGLIKISGTGWIEVLSAIPGLSVSYDENEAFGLIHTPVLMIRKDGGAPSNLRFLRTSPVNSSDRKEHIETTVG